MKTLFPLLLLTSLLALTTTAVWAEKADTHNHQGETPEEHAKHDDDHDGHDHKGETPEEHAKHDDDHDGHDHKGETPEERAKHADEHEGHDHEGHEHGKPHHGGIVSEVEEIHHELVVEKGKLVFYAEGLPKGEALNTVKVRLSILQGKEKQNIDMALAEGDQHRFEANSAIKLAEGDKVVALIRIEGQKPRMARFEIPAKPTQ